MQSEPHQIRGHHVLVAMLLFFGSVFAMNGYFIYKATTTFTGQDIPKSYVQGLHYNDVLESRAAGKALGWRAGLDVVRRGDGAAVTAIFRDASNAPIGDLQVTGVLRRPTQASLDQPVAFAPGADGSYIGEVHSVTKGSWIIRVVAQTSDGRSFEAERRVTLD